MVKNCLPIWILINCQYWVDYEFEDIDRPLVDCTVNTINNTFDHDHCDAKTNSNVALLHNVGNNNDHTGNNDDNDTMLCGVVARDDQLQLT